MDNQWNNLTNTSCAFTGHRPRKLPWRYDETDARCIELKSIISDLIAKMAASGVIDYYSGMADGADIFMSQAVLALRKDVLGLKLHCILPCDGQAEQWPTAAQERYYAILDQADTVSFVCHQYQEGCMLKRNRRLVDSAAFLLAVYNGEWRGGTAATVRYAKKQGRGIIIVDPATQELTFEGNIPNFIQI